MWSGSNEQIPKHAFNMSIANYDRLPTRSRLVAWGIPVSPNCVLCSNSIVTMDHLMLSCVLSAEIWREVFIRCQPPHTMFTNWSELLSLIRAASSAKLSLLRKIAVQAVVFHIWKQKNNLVHNQQVVLSSFVFQGIDREVKNIISSGTHNKLFKDLMILRLR